MIQIPPYRFIKQLSKGKVFDLCLVYSEEKKQELLIKISNQNSLPISPKVFLNYENKLIKKLVPVCPCVLNTLGFIENNHGYGLVFESPKGSLLVHALAQISNFNEKLLLCIRLTESLQLIHNQKIIFKNLNPCNIFYDSHSHIVQFIGFEIASLLKGENLEFKETANIEGDLLYIAPEQTHRMNHQIDYRSDYYSLGIIFYQIMTGSVPFHYSDLSEQLYAIMTKQPKAPHEVKSEIPQIVSQVILQLLNKLPEKRYQNLSLLKTDLQNCLEQWETKKQIDPFKINLGHPFLFNPSQIVYGREHQIKSLADSFIRSSQGRTKLTFISGNPGVGKSTVINEIFKPITAQKGYFITGVCDKNRRFTPYYAIVHAFQSLIEQILTESNESKEQWKTALNQVLGINGQLLINTIPVLESLIGPQLPLVEVEPAQNKNRFRYVFQKFIQVFASENHPLTIYLQDLQWADAQTLEILSDLVIDYNTRFLFLIGSFNDTEVNPSHILTLTLDEIKHANIAFHVINLCPLEQNYLTRWIKETFYQAFPHEEELVHYCFDKSQGNSFFIEQLLMLLIESSSFDFKKDILEKIFSGKSLSHLINFRIEQLSKSAQEILLLASCLGNTFSLKILAELRGESVQAIASEFYPALEKGLILPCSPTYRYIEEDPQLPVFYRFKHDKIREEAYSLLSSVKKKVIHYKVGKLLLHSCSLEKVQDYIFDITNQFNLGLDLLENEGEKQQVALLNYQAAKKAKSLSGFKVAVAYLKIAYDLLSPNSWKTNYQLTFDIYKTYSSCLFIDRQHEHAELIANQALEQAKTLAEKLNIIAKQVTLYLGLRKYEAAIDIGLKGLHLVKIKISKKPSYFALIKESIIHWWRFKNMPPSEVLQLPEMKNKEMKYALEILQNCGSCCYFSNKPSLNYLLVLKQINLITHYGINELAVNSFLSYAIILQYRGDLKKSVEFNQIFLPLLEKFPDTPLKGHIFGVYAFMLHGWYHPYKTLDYYYNKAIELGLEFGDSMAILLGCSYLQFWNPSIPLSTFFENSHKNLMLIKQTHNQNGWYSAKILFQYKANFLGLTQDTYSLSDQGFDEEIALKNLHKSQFYSGIAVYYLCKSIVYYHYGNSPLAWEYLQKANQYMDQLSGTLFAAEHSFYSCLILISLFPVVQTSFRGYFQERITSEANKLNSWALICPSNFLAYSQLVEAERHILQGDSTSFLQLYDKASAQAEKQEMWCCAGLINERAYKNLPEEHKQTEGLKYKNKAIAFYQNWGATAKVKYIKEL